MPILAIPDGLRKQYLFSYWLEDISTETNEKSSELAQSNTKCFVYSKKRCGEFGAAPLIDFIRQCLKVPLFELDNAFLQELDTNIQMNGIVFDNCSVQKRFLTRFEQAPHKNVAKFTIRRARGFFE